MAQLTYSDIQGFVLSSYAKNMPCGNYVILKITDVKAFRNWLDTIIPKITTAVERKSDFCLNIAFTATAFQKFGFTADELISFSVPFQEGMSTPTRQQILGDDGDSTPTRWLWGNEDNPVDMLLLLFAKDEDQLNEQLMIIKTGVDQSGGVQLIKSLSAGRQPDSHEHFGFLDGIGQPVIEGTDQKARQLSRTGHATEIKAGEFILGYENEMQKIDPLPAINRMPAFGKNGTYVVFRQIEQHVHSFWSYLKQINTGADGQSSLEGQEKLAAKMIGRWKSGAPISEYPHADLNPSGINEDNDFTYAGPDKSGFGCPFGAHIRRTNPRDSLFDDPAVSLLTLKRHRIIRRGRSYGDRTEDVYQNDGKERGLHFICINSNIERQFEFIQQTWVNNLNFATLDHETDPLIGHRNDTNMFTMPGYPARTRIHNLPDFVTMKGGAYFFMPGMEALKELAK
jgi:Dyp-type peroxidase family